MSQQSINDRYVYLQVRVEAAVEYFKENGVNHYDLPNSIDRILGNAIDSCLAVIQQSRNIYLDCKPKDKES